jgi:hypothetical protein
MIVLNITAKYWGGEGTGRRRRRERMGVDVDQRKQTEGTEYCTV